MKTKLLFIIILFFLLSYSALAESQRSTIELQAVVLQTIALYFDGKNVQVETNENEAVSITKTEELLTITPVL